MAAVTKQISLNPIVLPNDSRLFREPKRKYEDMTPHFLTRYDGHTIAVDVFSALDQLRFIGPSLFNLKPYAETATLKIDGYEVSQFEWIEKSRISRLKAANSGIAEKVELAFGPEEFEVRPGADDLNSFKNLNVVVTMNRDNRLENLHDWLVNFVQNHDVNAAIIYDNRSIRYSRMELAEALRSVKGLERLYVVDWPYKFGNTGGPKQIWDSDFGIYMCWEHARWRFLQLANAVFISDADEYPVSDSGTSLVKILEQTESGALNYPVRNVPSVPRPGVSGDRVRLHSDYIYADKLHGLFSKKVAYQPLRIPEEIQVGNHSFRGMEEKTAYTEDVIARHIRGVHYNWRNDDWSYSHEEREVDPKTEYIDEPFLKSLKNTFPNRFED